MNQTEIKYVTKRVNEVVACSCGSISTTANGKKKSTTVSIEEKLAQIRNGVAKLKSDIWLFENEPFLYSESGVNGLIKLYEYSKTPEQEEAERFNEAIERAEEDKHTNLELAGKKLIDAVVLGIIDKVDLPEALEKLARMFDE